jgi:FKBP-type peptidyl-prolyl cis-trans isomerase FklB
MSLAEKLAAAKQKKLQANVEAGLAYAAVFSEQQGVVCLPTGIMYLIHQLGDGKPVLATHTILCHYTGKLIDGKIFDTSTSKPKPIAINLSKVIKGWQMVLPLMPLGTHFTCLIPPAYAYGEQQVGALIAPNSTLIFEIQLLGIV